MVSNINYIFHPTAISLFYVFLLYEIRFECMAILADLLNDWSGTSVNSIGKEKIFYENFHYG